MKRIITLTILLFLLFISIGVSDEITLVSYSFCKNIQVTIPDDFTLPITCVDPTSDFLTTDERAFIVLNILDVKDTDLIKLQVLDENDNVVDEVIKTLPNLTKVYGYREFEIAGQNRPAGTYTVKMYFNDEEKFSDTFTITEDLSDLCEEQDLYCCPESKICVSSKEGTCSSGRCCENEGSCKTFSPNIFTRRDVPSCEEEEDLNDCGNVIMVYEYTLHGFIDPEQTVVIYYKGDDIDCGDKTDVSIAYYDEETGSWIEKQTHVQETSEGIYKATALLRYFGYIALIRSSECVPTFCTYGGYRTSPIGRYVNFGETITFELCGVVKGCKAMKDGSCSKQCTEGVDPDCGECTNDEGDCCLISYDGICDQDCAPEVDPDCCDKTKSLCCPGGIERTGSSACDKNCNSSDMACTGCKPEADTCCNPANDGICDPDCPKLSNGVGYVDNDCCSINGVSITSSKGDCCNIVCDGICDPDCIVGLDPDCHGKGCCGDGICDSAYNKGGVTESCLTCPDCGTYDYYYGGCV